jgi:hypothetical protein
MAGALGSAGSKSFLVLFFKKERLPFPIPAPKPARFFRP